MMMMMGNIFLFSLVAVFQNLCVIYPYSNNLSVHSCWYKNYKKTFEQNFIIMKFKNFSLKKNFFSLCCRAAGDVMGKTYKNFSLSQSFFSLCNLPQRKVVSTQLQTGYNGSQRVTTGPNGLERVPSQRVPTGLRGGGRKGQWHVYYLPNTSIILFISFI